MDYINTQLTWMDLYYAITERERERERKRERERERERGETLCVREFEKDCVSVCERV